VNVTNRLAIPGIRHVQVAFTALDERRIRVFTGLRLKRLKHSEMFSIPADCEVQWRSAFFRVVVDQHDPAVSQRNRINA
jgi:hypothetical protein